MIALLLACGGRDPMGGLASVPKKSARLVRGASGPAWYRSCAGDPETVEVDGTSLVWTRDGEAQRWTITEVVTHQRIRGGYDLVLDDGTTVEVRLDGEASWGRWGLPGVTFESDWFSQRSPGDFPVAPPACP